MVSIKNSTVDRINNYYTEKIKKHGPSPSGVDWNGEESQFLRFAQLSKIFSGEEDFSLIDLGCGYGALVDYLAPKFSISRYDGYDVSIEMVEAAKKKHKLIPYVNFGIGSVPTAKADFAVASGIFNVALGEEKADWENYIQGTLDILNDCSIKGFSFNCLTSYSDSEKMQKHLYYGNPCYWFDLCKIKYSKNVALLHDYGIYEFTILVRKDL